MCLLSTNALVVLIYVSLMSRQRRPQGISVTVGVGTVDRLCNSEA